MAHGFRLNAAQRLEIRVPSDGGQMVRRPAFGPLLLALFQHLFRLGQLKPLPDVSTASSQISDPGVTLPWPIQPPHQDDCELSASAPSSLEDPDIKPQPTLVISIQVTHRAPIVRSPLQSCAKCLNHFRRMRTRGARSRTWADSR